jgi:hypothetical protein
MTKTYDTKSNTVGNTSRDEINQEPPPPYTPPGQGSSNTNSSRSVAPYDGGATEQTRLIQQQQSSYTSPQYTPIHNFHYTPGGQVPPFQTNTVVPLQCLLDKPAVTTCPHCHEIVLSRIEHENGCCTCLSCLALCCLVGTTICSFIPFCVSILRDQLYYFILFN